jgi:hypothetical protein
VQALPVQLTAGQDAAFHQVLAAAFHQVLAALKSSTDYLELPGLAGTMEALAGKFDAAQAGAALGAILAVIKGSDNSDELQAAKAQALAEAVKGLAGKLDAAQAQAALGPVFDVMKGTADPLELRELAETAKALSVQLGTAQAGAALSPFIDAIWRTTDPEALRTLAETVEALPVQLDRVQAEAVLGPVVDAMKRTTDTSPLQDLAKTMQALAGKFDAAQAQVAVGSVVDAMKGADSGALAMLAGAVQALAPRLSVDHARAVSETVRVYLGWAPRAHEARDWAGALVALLPREPPEGYVEQIVEALKYPTSAGPATDVLLDALGGIDPNAPGKEAGLDANLAWLTTAYPAIDLDKPPDCPKPLSDQQDVTCPEVGG